jgi:sulfite exporter TauE/SafE
MNVVLFAFLAGLTTGGISCLAVQGGLLASSLSATEEHGKGRWMGVAAFLISKLIAYTILGFLLGAAGSVITVSPVISGVVQILVGIFMLATAARILELHPIFRYFVIQPPRWTYRLLKNSSRNSTLFGPFILGFLTILMPCGVTQATMAVAIASGSAPLGAGIMFAFVLGTSPVFFVLGATIAELLQRKAFAVIAATVIIIFGILSVNGGLGIVGSPYTIQNIYRAATTPIEELTGAGGGRAEVSPSGTQEVTIGVSNRGYTASAVTLKAGVPVRLTLVTDNTRGCSRAFTIPSLNISKVLPETGKEVIEFTPTKAGRLAYSCSMGMYTGAFTITEQ